MQRKKCQAFMIILEKSKMKKLYAIVPARAGSKRVKIKIL